MLKSGRFRPLRRRRKTTQTNYGEKHLHRTSAFAWAALAVVLVAVIAFFSVLAFRGYPSWTMMGGYPFYGWWFFPFGIFFFLFMAFLVFRFIFFGWTWGWRRRYWYGYGYGYGDAHEILRQRYARGEITKEQFDQMKRDLEQRQ